MLFSTGSLGSNRAGRSMLAAAALGVAVAAAVAAGLTAGSVARAATLNWDPSLTPTKPSGGNGTWDLATTNWSNGTSDQVWTDTTGTADTAIFGGTSSGTVTLNSNVGAVGLQFTTEQYTISGTGTLTLGTGGITASDASYAHDGIDNNIVLAGNQTWDSAALTQGADNGIAANGVISGSAVLTIASTGPGTVILNNTNTFTGGLVVQAGVVNLGATGAAGSAAITLGDANSAGQTATADFSGQTVSNAINVSATLTGETQILQSGGNNGSYLNGLITLGSGGQAGNLTIQADNGNSGSSPQVKGGITGTGNLTLNLNGPAIGHGINVQNINIKTGAVDMAGSITTTSVGSDSGTVDISSDIGSNVTGINQNSTQPLVLSGTNTYTGPTTVNGGALLITGSLASGSAVAVNSGGTLGGSGIIGGVVTLTSGGILQPSFDSATPTSLTVGSLIAGTGSTIDLNISGSSNDSVTVTTPGGLTYGGTLAIADALPQIGTYQLFTFTGAATGDFAGVTVNGNALIDPIGTWTGTSNGFDFSFVESTGVLTVSGASIPEPATLGLMAVMGASILLLKRRNSKNS